MEIPEERIEDPESGPAEGAAPAAVPGEPKRPYESPELIEWGSIVDLTRGPVFSFEDADAGGSQFV